MDKLARIMLRALAREGDGDASRLHPYSHDVVVKR